MTTAHRPGVFGALSTWYPHLVIDTHDQEPKQTAAEVLTWLACARRLVNRRACGEDGDDNSALGP